MAPAIAATIDVWVSPVMAVAGYSKLGWNNPELAGIAQVLADPAIHAAYPKLAITSNPWGRATMGCSSIRLCSPVSRETPPCTCRQGSPSVQATAPRA